MRPKRKADQLLHKVRVLLLSKTTQSEIVKILGISRYQMNKLIEQLIQANAQYRQRVSLLLKYERQIRNWLERGKRITDIHDYLSLREVSVHYSTVHRFVKGLTKKDNGSLPLAAPGEIAYVSLLPIYSSERSYLFCCFLGYSHFSYFCITSHLNLAGFLHCHINCFEVLNGVPKHLQLCEVSCLYLSPVDRKEYQKFLTYYGSCEKIVSNTNAQELVCRQQTRRAKHDIISSFFHSDIKKMALALKNKHAHLFNYSMHPLTRRLIVKEFSLVEQKALLPLPKRGFPAPAIGFRKVSMRGEVRFCYQNHKLPVQYAGHIVELIACTSNITIRFNNIIIAKYELPQS